MLAPTGKLSFYVIAKATALRMIKNILQAEILISLAKFKIMCYNKCRQISHSLCAKIQT